jgi:hypothetical protein
MVTALVVRKGILSTVKACVGGETLEIEASESKKMRHQIYLLQPGILVIDELAARGYKPLASVPRVRARCKRTKVIALLEGMSHRKKKLAVMAGCFDGIDVTQPSWVDDLFASLLVARRHLADEIERAFALARLQTLATAPPAAPRVRRSRRAIVDPPALRVVRSSFGGQP